MKKGSHKIKPVENIIPQSAVLVNVDWHNIAMPEAQQLYAELKSHFENAGRILNNRSMPQDDSYVCYMAGKPGCCEPGIVNHGRPRFTDYSRQDPKTGLMTPVKICSEMCSVRYQDQTIKERRDRLAPKRDS